jgi:hypothetical protein
MESNADFRLPADELASWRFADIADARASLGPPKGRRVAAALAALTRGSLVELTDSEPSG